MYKIIIVILGFVFLAGAAKGVSDTLQFHYSRSIFASYENSQWWNPAVSWKNKYRDYDKGDKQEAFLGSRSIFVWITDAWHLAQTIETAAWLLALLFALKPGYRYRALGHDNTRYPALPVRQAGGKLLGFFAAIILSFYLGFLIFYGWLLLL